MGEDRRRGRGEVGRGKWRGEKNLSNPELNTKLD